MEVMNAFSAEIKAGPAWVFWWVNYMTVVFLLAIPFSFVRVEARWTALVIALQFPAMLWLYTQVGFVRLLGITHIVFWTPLLIYLWRRRHKWRVKETLAGKWIVLLVATMLISLAFDVTDVIRYALGDRG